MQACGGKQTAPAGAGRSSAPLAAEVPMNKLRMKLDDLTVETFELTEEQEDAVIHGALKTLDPTKCEPHSCVPTFPC